MTFMERIRDLLDREEKTVPPKAQQDHVLDRIRGSLVGGAAGDALGYPVEFLFTSEIDSRFGKDGITEYDLESGCGKALISDDTQMTMFTADGILFNDSRKSQGGTDETVAASVAQAYLDWFVTQMRPYEAGLGAKLKSQSRLLDVPELYSRRAPGNTCMSALNQAQKNGFSEDFLGQPCNNSKGCDGVMRVAPLGLRYRDKDIQWLDREGAALCAITHGHPLGYLPGAVLTHILNRILYPVNPELTLEEIVREALDTVCLEFQDREYLPELRAIVEKAIDLAHNQKTDRQNIRLLGEGWVAEETLAISIYCALRYTHDFSAGIIAAVNHNGDSDSTGAVTGNILGAIHGFAAIADKWKQNLELLDVLLELADDLYKNGNPA